MGSTSHEKKELKRQQKEQEKKQVHEQKSSKKFNKNIVTYGLVALAVLVIVIAGYFFLIKPIKEFDPYYEGLYHWHANLNIIACGQPVQLRCAGSLCGPMNLHHHNDEIIHMEGSSIAQKSDLALGKFFEAINVPFSETQISNWKNGDVCPNGNPGEVHMYVDGVRNNEFTNYVPTKCDAQAAAKVRQQCDKIEIRFE